MKKEEEKEPNHERWLLTYSDLITLLMIFFVIMYASSNVSASKYKALSDSFKVALGGGKSVIGTDGVDISNSSQDIKPTQDNNTNNTNNTNPSGTSLSGTEKDKLENLKENVDKYLDETSLKNNINTSIEERGLVITLKDSFLFDSGKAEIKEETKGKIIELGKMLNKMDNYIRIEGHTDNVPINNSTFKSNWQLSVIRATNVTELLIINANIPPKKLSAVGYGEFRPIADNNSAEEKAKNRRVDIVILNSKLNEVENNKK